MKGLFKTKRVLMAACALTVGVYATAANAQTANMTATAEVLNTITLATPNQLNFGTIVAASDTVQTAYVEVDVLGAATFTTTGAPAQTAIVDGTAVSQGTVELSGAADGATLNITIDNVVDPFQGAETLILDQFTTSFNGGASTPQTIATPFTETYDAAFGGGTNTLDIGARVTTDTAATGLYTDGTYSGTYDVIVSY